MIRSWCTYLDQTPTNLFSACRCSKPELHKYTKAICISLSECVQYVCMHIRVYFLIVSVTLDLLTVITKIRACYLF